MVKVGIRDLNTGLSEGELAELEIADKMEPVFDEDSPEMTAEMLKEFEGVRNQNKNKQTVSAIA